MEININQKKIAIGDKYKIFEGTKETHYASAKIWRWMPELHLKRVDETAPRFILKKKWSWLRTTYEMTRHDRNVFYFKTVSIWKAHYECRVGSDLYEIFTHRGLKHSIYKNNVQVGWWTQDKVTWFAGDNYVLTADDDCDAELLMSFCLVLDSASDKEKDGAVKFNLGHIGPQAKKFNPDWKPKTAV